MSFAAAAPARAEDAPAPTSAPDPTVPPAPPAAAPHAPAPAAAPAPDPYQERREALFDIAFAGLASGRLELAAQSFEAAAALPGDPVRAAVAASFADRTRRLILQKSLDPSSVSPPSSSSSSSSSSSPSPAASDGARSAIPVLATLMGLGVYGWALPVALDVDDDSSRAFIGLYMLTAGASFATSYALTRTADVTPAEANLAYYGATRGLWHGVLLSAALFGNTSPSSRLRLWSGSLLLGSVGEMVGGYLLADRRQMTAGEARTMAVWGDFGLGWGLALGALLGLHHDDRSEDAQASGIGAVGFVGSAAGLASGYFLARRRHDTWGDGEVFRAAGLLGTWAGLTTAVVADWDPEAGRDEKKFFVSLIAGSALGLGVGERLVRGTDFSVRDALLVDLSTLAGALGVAGIAYLASADSSNPSAKGFATASLLGGALGYGLSYVAFSGDAPAASRAAAARVTTSAAPLTVAVVPALNRDGGRGVALCGSF